MKLLKRYYPFHLTLLIIIGILLEFHLTIDKKNLYIIISCITSLLTICFVTKNNYKLIFTISCSLLGILIGIIASYIKNDKNHHTHYKNKLTNNCTKKITITEVYKSTQYYRRYKAKIDEINGKKTSGKILIHIKKDSSKPSLTIGQQLITKKNLIEIPLPQNPYSFNYKEYLSKNNIDKQLYLDQADIIILATVKNSIYRRAYLAKQYLQQKTRQLNLKPITQEITNALLFGDKKLLKKETQSSFSNAGVIHILAISGLHVGIILFIFSKLLTGLNYIKYGKTIKATLIIIILWTYALITGLSPSVIRAATMFSFIHIGTITKRKIPIEYSIISSMLILLLLNPYYIFSLGFKMSYLAVFGIVWCAPFLKKIYTGKNKVIQSIWNLSSISITAQILILPLSIYHFHKFPSLFLIANLISIPTLGIIICLGLLTVFLNLIDLPIKIIINLYDHTIQLLYEWIQYIGSYDYFVFDNIYLNTNQMYLWYSITISSILFIHFKRPIYIIFILSNIIIKQLIHVKYKKECADQKEMIIFHSYKNSLITILNKNNLYIHSTDSTSYKVRSYERIKLVKNSNKVKLPNYFKINKQWFQIINSNKIISSKLIKNPIIILTNSPKLNMDRVLKKIRPLKVIADGSNYPKNIKLWKISCLKYKIPFHSTYEKGDFKH